MKESIGSTFLYTIIFIFIVLVFGFLISTINYYKAYKVNKAILDFISQYSGYNSKSKKKIEDYLESIGYTRRNGDTTTCSSDKAGGTLLTRSVYGKYYYCVYYHKDDRGGNESGKTNGNNKPIYYAYGVITYIYVDLPIIGKFRIPIYTKGERLYNFSDGVDQLETGW